MVTYRLGAEDCRCWLLTDSLRLRWRCMPAHAVQPLGRCVRVKTCCRHHASKADTHRATFPITSENTRSPATGAIRLLS